jgi:DNA polymerase III epsilon subunit-like protein
MDQNAAARARTVLQGNPLFFDTETTGLGKTSEIVEVGVVDAKGKTMLESLVRPRRRIPADAIAVHGISNEMVRDAPTWAEVWPQVRQLFTGRRVGIFNADFDLRMMRQSHQQHGLSWEDMGGSAFCVMKMYARYYGDMRGIENAKWQSLQKAGRQCGIALPNTHRAVGDARLTCAVFRHMAGIKEPL